GIRDFHVTGVQTCSLPISLAIVSTFLVLIYLKRNSRLKYTRDLEEKNRKIELQNEAIMEQAKHLEDINKVKDKLFSIVSHDLKRSEERRVGKEREARGTE